MIIVSSMELWNSMSLAWRIRRVRAAPLRAAAGLNGRPGEEPGKGLISSIGGKEREKQKAATPLLFSFIIVFFFFLGGAILFGQSLGKVEVLVGCLQFWESSRNCKQAKSNQPFCFTLRFGHEKARISKGNRTETPSK